MGAPLIFLLVEGRHDAEFLARLLALKGFIRRSKLSQLPENLRQLIPNKFPATDKARLTDPHPVPGFFQTADQWLAMLVGGGGESAPRLRNALRTATKEGFPPDSVGVFIDQDQFPAPEDSRDAFIQECHKNDGLPGGLDFSIKPGAVLEGSPRRGLFVLPDNSATGALEDILLECGEANYPLLKERAKDFRDDALANCNLSEADLKDYGVPGGQKHISKQKKAWISAMGAVLIPSAAIQNSIRENRWLEGGSLQLERVKAISGFLDKLVA